MKQNGLCLGTVLVLICAMLGGCGTQDIDNGDVEQSVQMADSKTGTNDNTLSAESAAKTDTSTAETGESADTAEEDEITSSDADTDSESLDVSDTVDAKIRTMTLTEKVYQMFIVTPEALTGVSTVVAAGDATYQALDSNPVGGIIYFSQNLETWKQTNEMLTNTQQYAQEISGIGVFLAVDEEGGTVARCADNLGTAAFDDMASYGASGDTDTAYSIGSTIGSDIHALGFNLDFAPVADVNINENNELGSRIFSSDASIVAEMTAAVTRGLQDNGVSATLKHFPGLGAGDGNTHNGSVWIDRSYDDLVSTEFVAF